MLRVALSHKYRIHPRAHYLSCGLRDFRSEGWIRLNLRDYEGALVAWQQGERLHGGQPFWVPYSKAIALMGMGDADAALAWWRVTQRAYAPELDSAAGARSRFQYWRPAELVLLERVIGLAYPKGPTEAARKAEIERIIEARRAQMRADAEKAQPQPQSE